MRTRITPNTDTFHTVVCNQRRVPSQPLEIKTLTIALKNCKKSPLNHFKEKPLKIYGMDNQIILTRNIFSRKWLVTFFNSIFLIFITERNSQQCFFRNDSVAKGCVIPRQV